jgi:hypothetical protein
MKAVHRNALCLELRRVGRARAAGVSVAPMIVKPRSVRAIDELAITLNDVVGCYAIAGARADVVDSLEETTCVRRSHQHIAIEARERARPAPNVEDAIPRDAVVRHAFHRFALIQQTLGQHVGPTAVRVAASMRYRR